MLATVVAFYKEFMVISFDPTLAVVLRLPATFLRYLLLVLIAVTIVMSLQTVGIALMLAMLVTPAATAQLLTRRLWVMMVLGAAIGATSNVVGLYLSYYINIASGPAMVLVVTAVFFARLSDCAGARTALAATRRAKRRPCASIRRGRNQCRLTRAIQVTGSDAG